MNDHLRIQIAVKFRRQCLFAHHLGLTDSYISKVIHGYKEPREETKQKWAKALDCTVQEIFPE